MQQRSIVAGEKDLILPLQKFKIHAMKNISAQYQDLLEGKMSKENFMRSIRRQFPQHISPTNTFADSVRILKSKMILTEAKGVYNSNAEAEKSRGIDHLNYYQVQKGIEYELAKMPEITDEAYVKAREKVVSKMLKDPDAYKDLQIANYKEIKGEDKDLEMKEVKQGNHVDKANGMKTVKKDVKGNTQDTLSKKEKKKGKGAKGVEQMTQNPKGKLKAFPTPGKEKAMTLKEHILEAKSEEWHTEFRKYLETALEKQPELRSKAKQAYELLGTEEVANLYGALAAPFHVNAFLGDLDGIIAHYAKNELRVQALKEHILDEMMTLNPSHEEINKGSRVKKKEAKEYDAAKIGNVVSFDGDTATVKWDDGSTEHVQKNILTKKEIPALPKDQNPLAKMPDLGKAGQSWASGQVKEADEAPAQGMTEEKKERLKQALAKTVKETMYTKTTGANKSTVVASSDAAKTALKQQGYKELPNTADVKAI